jgi:hypothetical protein
MSEDEIIAIVVALNARESTETEAPKPKPSRWRLAGRPGAAA